MFTKFIFLITALVGLVCAEEEKAEEVLRQRHPDVGLNVKQLIEKYGYPFENHTVQTEDGYLLDIYRISHGRNYATVGTKPAVILVPGLLCSSVDWVNMGSEKSLGFILADQGYDVWLANYRGTTWSRRHSKLNPDKDKEFWNYSFHEIAKYDLKAFIDYILHVTKQENLFYFGHSQGTTSFFALISERPEYNEKIRLAILLAPVVYIEHIKSPLIRSLAIYKDEIKEFVENNEFYEFMPHFPIITLLAQSFCNDDSPFQNMCASVFYLVAGFSPKQMNKTMIPVIASNTPAGASIKQCQHFAQFAISNSFHQYDYGEAKNLIEYGQPTPPEYDLSKVTSPVLLYYGSKDVLCSRMDVDRLAAQLSNVVLKRRIKGFNHLDYMWGIDVVKTMFSEILEIMKRY